MTKLSIAMKRGMLWAVTLLLLLAACDNKQHDVAQPASSDRCASERNPHRLGDLLECLKQKYDRNDPRSLDRFDKMCDYLPAAARFIQSNPHDVEKDQILISSMMDLPLTDYMTIWAPAVKQGYLKGFVDEHQLVEVFFSMGERVDMYLAYDAPVVQRFYRSLLSEKRISDVQAEYFFQWHTVGETAQALLDGKATKVVKVRIEHGELGYTPKQPDLTTACRKSVGQE